MSTFEDLTLRQIRDVGDKIGSEERAKLFMSGDLVLVERDRKVSVSGQSNGGVTYASGLDTAAFLADWTKFYRDVLGQNIDLTAVDLPPTRPGFNWGVAVAMGITVQQAYDKCAELFPADKYTPESLNDVVPKKNDVRTTAKGAYVIWLRDRVEADDELKKKSAKQLEEAGTNCNTLLERLLLELWFHWKTNGGHLDIENVTLCAGSRSSDGDVPLVGWDDGRLRVDWYHVDGRHDDLRARQAVSTPKAA
ncbi:MAG TPA: hypothetical protein VJJ72_01325 [Candidatus Paceibacterota bacterium]